MQATFIFTFYITLMGHFVLCDTTNRSSYQDKASKIGGRLNQKPNVYSLLMLKVRFRGNLLQRTSQILSYRHVVDRIFTFSISFHEKRQTDRRIQVQIFLFFPIYFLGFNLKKAKKIYRHINKCDKHLLGSNTYIE